MPVMANPFGVRGGLRVMMGLIRRAVAAEVVTFLTDPRHVRGVGCLSSGVGADRKWCGVGAIAEVAVRAQVIAPPLYWPRMDMWRYGKAQEVHVLPPEVCRWASCLPVGPELVVPPYSVAPTPMLYLSDVGVSFSELARAISDAFLPSVPA